MSTPKPDTKEKTLIQQLKSPKENEVLSAIKSIKTHGTIHSVEPLLICWNKSTSQAIDDEIQNVFSSLKISNSQPIVLEKLSDDAFQKIRQPLLNALWQSGIEYADHIPVLTEIAVKGNYMEVFEVITVIENLEGPFDETSLMDAIWIIKNNKEKVDASAKPMIDELEKLLNKLNNQL